MPACVGGTGEVTENLHPSLEESKQKNTNKQKTKKKKKRKKKNGNCFLKCTHFDPEIPFKDIYTKELIVQVLKDSCIKT